MRSPLPAVGGETIFLTLPVLKVNEIRWLLPALNVYSRVRLCLAFAKNSQIFLELTVTISYKLLSRIKNVKSIKVLDLLF